MLNTLAFLVALQLAPAQAGHLTITNVRPLYSPLGPERTSDKLIPGEIYFVGFTTDGMKVGQDGRVEYSIGLDLSDSTGKVISSQTPRELQTLQSLGGAEVQMYATIIIGANQPPGDYGMKVTVRDIQGKTSADFTRKFQIVKPRFGIIRLRPTLDPTGLIPAPTVGVPGQNVWVGFWIVGFQRGPDKQPNVTAELQVFDEDGKPTIAQPGVLKNQPLEGNQDVIQMSLPLALNRPGKFKIRIRATDQVTRKKFDINYPITVVPNK